MNGKLAPSLLKFDMRILQNFLLPLLGAEVGKNTRFDSMLSTLSARQQGIQIGSDNILSCRFSLDREGACISIGNSCYIGKSNIVSAESVIIEDDVVISWGVTIVDHNSHSIYREGRRSDVRDWHDGRKDWQNVDIRPVLIKQGVWIGFNAIILKGVTLGAGAVVGAGSVVTKDVQANTVVAGNPARVIRNLDLNEHHKN